MIWLILIGITIAGAIVSLFKTECLWGVFIILLFIELIIVGHVRYDDKPSDVNTADIVAKLECDSDYLNVTGYTEAVEYNKKVEMARDLGDSIWFGAIVRKRDRLADPIPLENYKITIKSKN
ncbi:MAG: hypothetical protein J6W35_08085 [Eubacterium sp.]|nr:hypothetical protein [Eubacterium sp.]